MQTGVVEDEQVRGDEGPEGLVGGVVHPGLGHGPEEVVGVYEQDGVSGPDGCISESLCEEALAHADRTCSLRGRNWSEKAALRSRRSSVMAADQSKS